MYRSNSNEMNENSPVATGNTFFSIRLHRVTDATHRRRLCVHPIHSFSILSLTVKV